MFVGEIENLPLIPFAPTFEACRERIPTYDFLVDNINSCFH